MRFEAIRSMREAGSRSTTMIDVAEEAGVSLKTVSRVCNGEPYVRDEKRQRVLEAIAKLDYCVNHAARSLRTKSSTILALVFNPSDGYIDSLQAGAVLKCHQLGLDLVMDRSLHIPSEIERLIKHLEPRGVFVAPPLCDDPDVLAILDKSGVDYVLISPSDPNAHDNAINMDEFEAAKAATEHLVSLGHKRIGFIAGPKEFGLSEKRLNGYLSAIKDAGIDHDSKLIKHGDLTWHGGLIAAKKLLNEPNPPTAIFASNDDMAAAVLGEAYKRDIPVPTKLSVVGFDNSAISRVTSPKLTTVDQPVDEMATLAIDILENNYSRPEHQRNKIKLGFKLMCRESSAVVRLS